MPDVRKEEFDDWPQALLSIGTFGNKELKEDLQGHELSENLDSSENLEDASQDFPDFTSEEVRKLQQELANLLSRKPKPSTQVGKEERANLPLNRFLNCPSSLEVDRTGSLRLQDELDNNKGDLSPDTKIILNKVKDLLLGNRSAVKKKTLTFLLKKIFVCRSGFSPAPSLRDPIQESRMEKILRTLLQKKIFARSSASSSVRKCLEERPGENVQAEKKKEKGEDRCKWVKTDSEYIVLEI
ncbi:protein DEEPER ROOTING 1-like [Phoenix dactylifera]|uniref:Protein DEEPER ROOTING 1-like n=1 Tax=Phoenix dactylifera TaxID=42345 RepID=A0A8B9AK87_PHODC|nr:protein DEEPER ROOTING 1-like [Phoenix dactylifera]